MNTTAIYFGWCFCLREKQKVSPDDWTTTRIIELSKIGIVESRSRSGFR
jgi:hypothetical protein